MSKKNMLTLCGEVEYVTNKYRGVMFPGAFHHLTLQEHEQEFLERLREKGQTEDVTLLMYNSRHMFREQILVHREAVSNDMVLLCIALFTVNRSSDSIHFDQFCLVTRAEWDKATVSEKLYRTLYVNRLLKIDLRGGQESPPPLLLSRSLAYSSDSISMTADEEVNEEECNVLDIPPGQFRLFWLHEVIEDSVDEGKEAVSEENDYLIHYTAFLFDVLVWQRFFSDYGNELKKRMLKHYASVIGEHHSAMTLLFISQVIQQSSGSLTERMHQERKDSQRYNDWFIELSETRFYKQWLEAEVFLFKCAQWHKDLLHQKAAELQQHIHYITLHLPSALHNNWISYTVDDKASLYWLEVTPGTFKVSGNWLFKPEFDSLLEVLPLENGFIHMSSQVFQTIFMPTLYRCTLEDVYRCLFYLHHTKEEVTSPIFKLRMRYHCSYEKMKELARCLQACNLSSATSIFDCVATLRDGNVNSPATKKMLKKRAEFDQSRRTENKDGSSHRVPWSERVIVREDLPDIEDLGSKGLVPPCMSTIFDTSKAVRPRLGNNDKMNITKYLIDLAYSKMEVIHFLGKGYEQDASYLIEIANKYDSFSRAKRMNTLQITTQHHSFYCSSIINTMAVNAEKNHLRCPFADKQCSGSARRKDFKDNEKEVFREACGKTLRRPSLYPISHPVQYSLFQLATL